MAPTQSPPPTQAESSAALQVLARLIAGELRERLEPPDPPREVMTIEQTAAYLGCSRAKVYALVRAAGLPTVRIGCAGQRVMREALLEWLRRQPAGGCDEDE